MEEYLLLLKTGHPSSDWSKEEEEEYMSKWKTYMYHLDQNGNLRSGFPLLPEGYSMNRSGTSEQLFLQSGDIEGFLRVVVRNREELISISQSCPTIEYGGTIEARRLMTL